MRSAACVLVSLLSLALGAQASHAADSAAHYHLVKEVPLAGDEFWDYLSFDSAAGRLFVSHGTKVQVVDGKAVSLIGEVPDTPGVHGVAVAADLGRGYVSAGRAGSVVVFDLKTLQRITDIKTTGDNPDTIIYDPATQRVFTFNGRSNNITAVDAVKNVVVGTIALNGRPEFAAADGAGHIYLNLEDKNSLAQIDSRGLKVEQVWPITGCDGPSGLAMDKAHRRVFSVCSNKVMAVTDADSGRTVTTLPISSRVDAAVFDPGKQLAFASGGDGTLTVVRERSPDKFEVVQSVSTKAGARTMALDEHSHRVFLVTAQLAPPPAPTADQPRPRPTIVAGSFEVLVLEP